MKIEKRDGSAERRILIGMIVDKSVLGRIASKWDPELFRSKWSNLVASWCVKFFGKYNAAPGKSVENLFESWAAESRDKETIELVERFLSSLSDEYESLAKETNPDYLIDLASDYFNKVRLKRLAEVIEGGLEEGNIPQTLKAVESFNHLEIGSGEGIDVLQDQNALMDAFEGHREPLITYPGDLGKFFGSALERDAFISFEAPEKRGKSFVLMDLAYRAMLQRRKVAFFAVGDMSQRQMLRRFAIRAAGAPLKPQIVNYPLKIEKDPEEKLATVVFEEREFTKGLTWQQAWKSFQKVITLRTKTNQTLLRMSVHPNTSINVQGIRSILQTWERQDWIPDIILIDYADILAPPFGSADTRDQINATWKQLRALSQSLHCLVVTATQTDAGSYGAETIGMENFSEDKRKRAHVTGSIGINRTREEKDLGIYRFNWIVLREDAYREGQCVHVAGCLPIGNPCIRSTF